jgi:hypothetical protein
VHISIWAELALKESSRALPAYRASAPRLPSNLTRKLGKRGIDHTSELSTMGIDFAVVLAFDVHLHAYTA